MQNIDRWFASDNNAAVHPTVMAALAAANQGHAIGYGHDPLTEEAERAVADLFGEGYQVRFALNGTGANVYALGCLAGHAEAIFCSACAHIFVDESGGPSAVVGAQLVPLAHEQGKIQAYELLDAIARYEDMHKPAPRVLSLSQPTELGTVYSPDELNELIRIAHERGMAVHIDGARLANAAAFLAAAGNPGTAAGNPGAAVDSAGRNAPPADSSPAAAGVSASAALRAAVGQADLICFGGTKNGLMFGEAVVFAPRAALAARAGAGIQATEGQLASAAGTKAAAGANASALDAAPAEPKPAGDAALALDTERLRKAHLQLSSKMRFLAAQFLAYVKDELWLKNAAQANAMAMRLAQGAAALRFNPAFSVDTNAVFVMMAPGLADELKAKRFFYDWDGGLVRLMASWDSAEAEVDEFLKDLKEADERFEEERAARKKPEVRSPSQDAELKRQAAACRRLLRAELVPVDIIPSDQRLGLPPPPLQVPLAAASSADGDIPAAADKAALVPLPAPQAVRHLGSASFESVTAARKSRRAYGPQEISQEELSFLIWACAGIKQPEKAKRPGTVWALRTVPSGGCRHPLELFVYLRRVSGIKAGLYRYRPIEHALAPVGHAPVGAAAAQGAALEAQDAAFDRALYGQLWDCAALFVWTAVPYRTEWRYHMAAAKIILLDAGHACQALYGACEALGLGTCALGAYEQAALDRLLGLDSNQELAIYAAPVGRPKGSEQSD